MSSLTSFSKARSFTRLTTIASHSLSTLSPRHVAALSTFQKHGSNHVIPPTLKNINGYPLISDLCWQCLTCISKLGHFLTQSEFTFTISFHYFPFMYLWFSQSQGWYIFSPLIMLVSFLIWSFASASTKDG